MPGKRSVVVVLLVALLTLDLFAANLVVAGHRTVLDPGFVTDSLAEEEAYATIHEAALSGDLVPIDGNETGPGNLTDLASTVAPSLVTPEYLRRQTETNVRRVYGYLHGREDELVVAVNLTPVIERVDDAVAAVVRNNTIRELLVQAGVEEGLSFSPEGVPVNASLLLSMEEGPEEYEDARSAFREAIREEVLSRLTNETYAALSDDERLALVIEDYDPSEYTEEEKDAMVADREDEIRAALRERIERERGAEIDAEIEERMPEIRETMTEAVRSSVDTGMEGVDRPTQRLLVVFVDGLTTDMSYSTFRNELSDAKVAFAEAVGDAVQRRVDREVPGRLVLTDEMDPRTLQSFETARTAVRTADGLGIALPLLALALIGLLWWATRSAATVALGTGAGLLVVGAVSYVGGLLAEERIRTVFVEATADLGGASEGAAAVDLATAIVGRVVGALQFQSLALAVVGVLLVVAGLAVRAGVLADFTGE